MVQYIAACYYPSWPPGSSCAQGVKFVREELDFDKADSDVSVFELTIRAPAA